MVAEGRIVNEHPRHREFRRSRIDARLTAPTATEFSGHMARSIARIALAAGIERAQTVNRIRVGEEPR